MDMYIHIWAAFPSFMISRNQRFVGQLLFKAQRKNNVKIFTAAPSAVEAWDPQNHPMNLKAEEPVDILWL